MKRKLALASVLVLGLILGFAIGATGKTNTVTRTKTVTAVPAACLRAIADTRALAAAEGPAFGMFGQFGPMVATAARDGAAGDTGGLVALARRGERMVARLNALGAKTKTEAVAFNADAASCR